MRNIGYHPFSVEQKMTAFCKTEYAASESLYQEWAKRSEGEKYSHDYRALFLEMEDAIRKAMKEDRLDKHDTSDRGRTPPPKGYESKLD